MLRAFVHLDDVRPYIDNQCPDRKLTGGLCFYAFKFVKQPTLTCPNYIGKRGDEIICEGETPNLLATWGPT